MYFKKFQEIYAINLYMMQLPYLKVESFYQILQKPDDLVNAITGIQKLVCVIKTNLLLQGESNANKTRNYR